MRFVFILFIMLNVNISMAEVNIIHKLTLYHDENDIKTITIEEGENTRMLKVKDNLGNVELSKNIEDGVVSLFTLTDNGDHFFMLSSSGVAYVLTGYFITGHTPEKMIEIYSREAPSFY